jgi:hypothetical protein
MGGIPRAIRGLAAFWPGAPSEKGRGIRLIDVLAGSNVLLGTHGLRKYHVSLDDIAGDRCFDFGVNTRNAFVISAYSGRTSALQRAVLSKLESLSPDNFKQIDSVFDDEHQMVPGRVLSFPLIIPNVARTSFPVDNLIVAVYEEGSSGQVGDFEWVKTAFQIAEKQGADWLIVPCLGREWRDKNSIDFQTFFQSFVKEAPIGDRPPSVCFSLYRQWPSFELEDAVKSLNSEWGPSSMRAS